MAESVVNVGDVPAGDPVNLLGVTAAGHLVKKPASTLMPASAASGFAPAAHVGTRGDAHAEATDTAAGFMSAASVVKLGGIASGATANATDSALRDRSSHTGTQGISTVEGLPAALNGINSELDSLQLGQAERPTQTQADGRYLRSGVAVSLSEAINEAAASVVSSATASAIWAAKGNNIALTGTATITAFPAAPQAGAVRWLTCAAGITITNSANIAVQGAASYTTRAGDVLRVEAITTTTFRVSIFAANGRSPLYRPAALVTGYTNGWEAYPGFEPRYWRDCSGATHLEGAIRSGAVGQPAFTLPAGFRPVLTNFGAAVVSNAAFGFVQISTAGVLMPTVPSVNDYIYLSGIVFLSVA
ncbi:MAG: hypothetical protein REI09_05190 [Candidatus Dactylopiibacterium sp.]|nr:hypothetical protein [Candidatus Dactylopiibacterium sp.]